MDVQVLREIALKNDLCDEAVSSERQMCLSLDSGKAYFLPLLLPGTTAALRVG